ncbi:MAG: acyl-CoA dehydrogenase family protein, partial [Caulobacteraceae bacterium]|nr:acyl-CoA dehydrogenase family protein [Caulobacteraceae bacterium]
MTAPVVRIAPSPMPLQLDRLLPALTAQFEAGAAAHDADSTFPFENFAALKDAGLLALTAPRELGGGAADLKTALTVIRAVARGEPATALVLTMQYLFHASLADGAEWPPALRRRVIE